MPVLEKGFIAQPFTSPTGGGREGAFSPPDGGGVGGEAHNPAQQILDIHIRQLSDVLAGDAEMKGLAVQARAVALRADVRLGELLGPFLGCGTGLAVLHHLDVLDETVVLDIVVVGGVGRSSGDAQTFGTAVENLIDSLLRDILQGCLQRCTIALEQGFHLPEDHLRTCLAQGCDTAFLDRQRTVREDLVGIDEVDIAEALTARTPALRRVEGKVMGGWVGVAHTRRRAHQATAIITNGRPPSNLPPIGGGFHIEDHHQAFAHLHAQLHTLFKSFNRCICPRCTY